MDRIILVMVAAVVLLALPVSPAQAGDSYDNCDGFIDSVPVTIGSQGVWCLRKNLSTSISSGAAVTINTNNVTINCKDHKIGGLAAGMATRANGVMASNRSNITVAQCNIRGFFAGVSLEGGLGGGHLVEGSRFDANRRQGIRMDGDGSIVRDNIIAMTGGSTDKTYGGIAEGIYVGSGDVDILDNVISGVVPGVGQVGGSNAVGIEYDGGSGVIRNNRIRGLAPSPEGWMSVIAINAYQTRSLLIQENHLVGTETGDGVVCSDLERPAVLRGNTMDGFSRRDIGGCEDGGGNLFYPLAR